MLDFEADKYISLFVMIGYLIPAVIHDLREKKIPDRYIIPGCISLILLKALYFNANGFIFLDALAGYLVIWVVWLLSKGKIGRGDAKITCFLAIGLQFYGCIIAIFWASLSGLLTGIILVKCKKMKKEDQIPFAPFLAIGGLLSFFTKDLILRF